MRSGFEALARWRAGFRRTDVDIHFGDAALSKLNQELRLVLRNCLWLQRKLNLHSAQLCVEPTIRQLHSPLTHQRRQHFAARLAYLTLHFENIGEVRSECQL